QPARALDFHPLASLDLAGGVYAYDNILIPRGVTVTLLGEPKSLSLIAVRDIVIDGTLAFDAGWRIELLAGGAVRLDAALPGMDGMIAPAPRDPIAGGVILVSSGGDLSLRHGTGVPPADTDPRPGGDIRIAAGSGISGGTIITAGGPENPSPSVVRTPPVPEPETWALLLAGLGLVGWAGRRRPA
nr:PEPxxWA-CTERM sorting domain-containing protein [Thiobacillaceae bacterium]